MTRTASARIVLAGVLLVSLVAVPAAFAGKPGGATSAAQLALRMVTDQNADGKPNFNDQITFAVSTTATDKPYVNVVCYQGGTYVYGAWVGFYPGAWFGQTFDLSSDLWQGGAADCVARLVMWTRNGSQKTLGTMAFRAEA